MAEIKTENGQRKIKNRHVRMRFRHVGMKKFQKNGLILLVFIKDGHVFIKDRPVSIKDRHQKKY